MRPGGTLVGPDPVFGIERVDPGMFFDQLADLSTDDQQALLRWLDEHRDAMVLSFATNAIFRLMTDGKFSERLFYRLNSITLSVDEDTA